MPFAIAGLAELLASALALMLAIAVWVLMRGIGSVLPKVHFPVIGSIDFGAPFVSAGNAVADFIVNLTKDSWSLFGSLIHATAWIFSTIFGEVVNAIDHAFDYADHLATSVIPDTLDSAEKYAREQAAGAVSTVATEIRNAYSEVGAQVHAVKQDAIDIAEGAANTALGHALADAASIVAGNAIAFDGDVSKVAAALAHAVNDSVNGVESDLHDAKKALTASISNLADTVASDFTQAKAIAQADATAALNTAKGLVDQAKAEAEDVAKADVAAVRNLLQAAINATNTTVRNLTTTVGQDLTAAEQFAQSQVAQAVSTVTGQLQSTAASLQQSIAAGAAAALAGVQSAVNQAQADATAALDTATATLDDALGGIYTDLTGKSVALNGDLSAIEGLLAGAITAGIAAVAARVATLEDCVVTNCDRPNVPGGGKNDLTGLLKTILGISEFAGLGAFLTAAISNPAGVEQEYANLVQGAIGTGRTVFDELLAL